MEPFPFAGSGLPAEHAKRRRPARVPPTELSSPRSLVSRTSLGTLLTEPLGFCPFPNEVELQRPTGHRVLIASGSFSLDSSPSRSSFADLPPRAFRREAPPAWVSSLSAVSLEKSTVRDDCRHRSVPSSGFLDPSTVCSFSRSTGLFRPVTTPRVFLFRVLEPDLQRACDSSPTASPLPFRSLPSRAFARVRFGTRRLRGLVPEIDREPPVWVCPLRWFASLPSFLLQVFPSHAVGAIARVIRS